jgi:hypothetical protein
MLTSGDNTYKEGSAFYTMPSTLVSVRIPAPLLKEAKKFSEENGYTSVQELLRENLRRIIAEAAVRKYAGSLPHAKPLTRASRDEAYRAFIRAKGWQ